MKTPKYKHLTIEDRYIIQEYLDFGYNSTQISLRLQYREYVYPNNKFNQFPSA